MIERPKPGSGTDEGEPSEVQTSPPERQGTRRATLPELAERLQQRIRAVREHPDFPAIAASGSFLLAVVLLGSLQQRDRTPSSQIDASPDTTAASDGAGSASPRKSPTEHVVGGYTRLQHYGTAGSEVRMVNVAPYSRGRKSPRE